VAELAGRLAAAAGWPPARVGLLREAALVHDVGKIGIPDAILLKSAPLLPEEVTVVREHAALGAKMVEDVLSDEQVAWVGAHHERCDGRGYPAGLHGAEIPDGAALLAVADAWDVMTASRSYSLPVAPDIAMRECAEGRAPSSPPPRWTPCARWRRRAPWTASSRRPLVSRARGRPPRRPRARGR